MNKIFSVYIYTKDDPDLMAIHEAGYSLGGMIKVVLTGYVYKRPIKLINSQTYPLDLTDKKNFKVTFSITDEKIINLLKNIKNRHMSSFCKALLRSSFATPNFAGFFSHNSVYIKHEEDAIKEIINTIPSEYSIYNISDFKLHRSVTQITFTNIKNNKNIPTEVSLESLNRPTDNNTNNVSKQQEILSVEQTQYTENSSVSNNIFPMNNVVPSEENSDESDISTHTDAAKNDKLLSIFEGL